MPRIARALLLVGGGIVVGVLVWRVGPGVIAAMLRRVGWGFLIVCGLYSLHVTVRAAALWRSLPHKSVAFSAVWRVRLSGEAVEMLTFTGPFLAEPAKGWMLKACGLSAAEAYGSIAMEYLLYTLAAGWMAAASLSVLLARNAVPYAIRAPVIGIVGGVIAFTLGFTVVALSGRGLIAPIIRGLQGIVGRRAADAAVRIAPAEGVLVGLLHDRPARLVELLAIEAGGHALLVLEIYVVIRALGYDVGLIDTVVLEGASKFIAVVFFFVPGQVGASEGIYTLLFRAIGLPAAAGLTMALVRRVRGLIVGGLGMAILAWTGHGPRQARTT
jgi:hypothetical protein